MNLRILIQLLICILLLEACRKQSAEPSSTQAYNNKCVQECLRISASVAFKDHNKEDVETIILYKYPYNNNFKTELSKETVAYNGVVYRNFQVFPLSISDKFDYRIEVPATGISYYIHSGAIPYTIDTLEAGNHGCGHILPCATYAPYVLVNEDTADIWMEIVGSNGYRVIQHPYIILEKE